MSELSIGSPIQNFPYLNGHPEADRVVIVSGDSHPELAVDMAISMGVDLAPVNTKRFPNSELYAQHSANIRGKDVFVVQPHIESNGLTAAEALVQQSQIIMAAKESAAARITAVSPVLYGAKQDRQAAPRENTTIRFTLRTLWQAGADELVTVRPHSLQSLPIFEGPVTPLNMDYKLIEAVMEEVGEDRDKAVILSPDPGSAKTSRQFSKDTGLELIQCDKERDPIDHSKVTYGNIEGVKGRVCVITDDMIDTGGTIVGLAEAVIEAGAAKVIIASTHGYLSENAIPRLAALNIHRLILTEAALGDKLRVIRTGGPQGQALAAMILGESVSELPQGRSYS